jgi:hypothetical protein
MKLQDASFLIIIYSFLMSNNKVRNPLTDTINMFMTLYEIVFRIYYITNISINEIKKMSENGLRELFRINKIKIIMSVTGLHNKATY